MRLAIRIDLDEETAFGPGKAALLETLGKTGSIRSAATKLGMSYRRAWLLIRDIEATLGAPVVVAKTGGSGGGGVTLTELGRTIAKYYRQIERHAAAAVAPELKALSRLCARNPHTRRPKTKRRRLQKR